jgi:branched-chain amino acid transport system ATP-binding protein
MDNNQIILEVKKLTINFGALYAVNNIDLKVYHGEILGIIGPNGAGKTTFFNLISGILKPAKGSILFQESNIEGRKPDYIAKLGIGRTFQVCRPFGDLTVIDNVLIAIGHLFYDNIRVFHYYYNNNSLKSAADILKQVGLGKRYFDTFAKDLPLVFQRRLEIARALALNPKLLLLDESAAGLTYEEGLELIELIKKLQQEEITIMLIEHNMRVIMNVSERMYAFDQGEVIAEGTPIEVGKNEKVIKSYLGEEENEC